MNIRVTGVTAGVFIIVFCMCCKCSCANRIRHRRAYSAIGFDDDDVHAQQCHALCRENSCRQEYIQSRARYILSCSGSSDDISGYSCARHRNGTLCEALVEGYFGGNSYYRYRYYGYDLDSNRSCSYSECSEECSMILKELTDTWGCCFHEWIDRTHRLHLEGFTIKNDSRNYWRSCGVQPPQKCHYDFKTVTIDPVECTNNEQVGHLVSEYQCTPLPRFLTEAKTCAYLYYRSSALCAMKDGKRCQEWLYYSNYTDNLFAKARQDCSRTSDVCSLGCKTTLQFLHDHVGCCLTIDNRTDSDSGSILRYGLWRACGIEPPGHCSTDIVTQLQSGSGFPVVSSSSIAAFLIITLAYFYTN